MNSRSASIVVPASKDKVFSYIADIENLPKWATEFALELKVVDGKHKIKTPMGELFFRIDADEKTGIVDMLAGPTEDQIAIFPARVAGLSGESSVFIFTMFQSPDLNDEQFEEQYQSLVRELENIKKEFSQ